MNSTKCKYKKGSTAVSVSLTFMILAIFLVLLTYTIINLFIPFLYYQKLDTVANKYLFVIEKFGYLTNLERNNLTIDLEREGFDTSKINIVYPKNRKAYGELVEFSISYAVLSKNLVINNGFIGVDDKETIISIRKNSFSKFNL